MSSKLPRELQTVLKFARIFRLEFGLDGLNSLEDEVQIVADSVEHGNVRLKALNADCVHRLQRDLIRLDHRLIHDI